MRRPLVRSIVGALLLASSGACTTTHVDAIDLRDTKILVIGFAAVPANRVKFEDALAQKLRSNGIAALASHTLLPSLESREAVLRAAKENAVTGVVAVAPVATDANGDARTLAPAPFQMHDKLETFLDTEVGRTTTTAARVAFVTHLYRIKTGSLLWGGVSWSFELADVDAVIEETSTIIAGNILGLRRQLLGEER
jgi:hypothetical protein